MKSLVLLFITIYIRIVSSPIISLAYNIHNISIFNVLDNNDQFQKKFKN
jgi:hypothetical protein